MWLIGMISILFLKVIHYYTSDDCETLAESKRKTVSWGSMFFALAMLSMEKGLIHGLVEFDRNFIDTIVLKGDPVSFKKDNSHN